MISPVKEKEQLVPLKSPVAVILYSFSAEILNFAPQLLVLIPIGRYVELESPINKKLKINADIMVASSSGWNGCTQCRINT